MSKNQPETLLHERMWRTVLHGICLTSLAKSAILLLRVPATVQRQIGERVKRAYQ
ncbi:hypothetical protein FIBSPDRAFT_860573 [Athelia psychrophila]|uniref:Uncharacterized protein n=1 Tax=Athelia psychrophila TaxID=1759441 RepID=A0A166K874_9AGAM|nr:hypothetical protein FIBSPDRAFT_860573 [Fibularhizoctonia sp. CBS 109695]